MIPLSDTKTSGHFPSQVIGLIAICCYVFFQQFFVNDSEQFILRYAFIPSLFSFSDLSTGRGAVTAIFLHGGILHLASNMLFLWVFGDNVEQRLRFLFLPFFILGGVVGNLGQYFLDPGSPIPVIRSEKEKSEGIKA